MKKIILPVIITLFLTIFSGCTTSEIRIPSNLDVKDYTLTWTLQNDVKYYEVEMTIHLILILVFKQFIFV